MKSRPSREFQSTPPVKAATFTFRCRSPLVVISIHAAREGGDVLDVIFKVVNDISIHAAREGGDKNPVRFRAQHKDFNPRRP